MNPLHTQDPNRLPQLFLSLKQQLEVARQIVYEVDSKTPVDRLELAGGQQVFVKREDLSKVHSYKWRGAYCKLRQLLDLDQNGPFIAASAGNHAQGVAIAANQLNVNAIIFMPRTTPRLKQLAVKKFGGSFVEIRLVGDCFDDASAAASEFLRENGGAMIKPFDDPAVIAGQATVGLELFEQVPSLSKLYVPIGGGGLASGVAYACKVFQHLDCKVIGVEVEKQNSMQLSSQAGQRIQMAAVDGFCDGTAVRTPGEQTFELCEHLLDEIITVTNDEVSVAIKTAWETGRFLPEPSGAVGLAAVLKMTRHDANEQVGTIVTGSNMDFKTLPRIVRQSCKEEPSRKYFRFRISETHGSLIELLDTFLADINIVDFQYGKSDEKVALPVLGVEGSPLSLAQLSTFLKEATSFKSEELTDNAFLQYRVIPFQPSLCADAFFMKIDFPDRPGSLRELMRRISGTVNICYFNFVDTGEPEGHALIGFESLNECSRSKLLGHLAALKFKFTNVSDVF